MDTRKSQSQLLDAKILALEKQQRKDLEHLRSEFDTTYQALRPSSLLNRALEDINEEKELKHNLFETLVSIAGGYLSKKLLVGKSKSVFKNLLGYALQYITSRFISSKI